MAPSTDTIPALPAAAARMQAVIAPVIPRVAALMQRRPEALSLAQGMVGWGPPTAVREAVAAALEEPGPPLDRYGPMAGDPELLEAIGRELLGQRQLDPHGSQSLVTAGSNMAFNAIAQVLLAPGDQVFLPLPYYFNHAMAVQLAGGEPVPVAAGLLVDPERLAAAIGPRTRAIVTISPGNPSGVVLPEATLAAINRLCARHGLFHISDEAYAAFSHGAVPHWSPGSLAGSAGHTISLYSLSKAYGMAGWRIGYAAVPAQLGEALAKVQDTVLICPPRISQRAALAALMAGEAWCQPHLRELAERRRQLLAAVAAARGRGLDVDLLVEPDGAFYGLLEFASPLAGEPLIERLVLEHGVATLPGESFGLSARPGRAVLRLSYGMLAAADLDQALTRLLNGVAALSGR